MAKISINTSGLADNMKPQVLQALNKVINDPVIRGQINSLSEIQTLTFQFVHDGLVKPNGDPTGLATASNKGPNQAIKFNLDRMGIVDGEVYFGISSLLKKPFIDNAIHETMHIVYPDLTGPFHDGVRSEDNVTRGQEAAGEFAFRTFTTSMTAKGYARALILALFLCTSLVHSANAMSGLITDFVEASSEKIEALAPRLLAAYPRAHFLISGFSSPLGEWAFIRVEDANSCENDLCPTVIILEKVEWKVLVVAKKQVEISSSLENGGAITCKLISKDGLEIIFRYANGDKILYVAK